MQSSDLPQIINRLKTLKTAFGQEEDDIAFQLSKLKKMLQHTALEAVYLAQLAQMVSLVEAGKYAEALVWIESFVQDFHNLSTWEDPEILALKREIETLESSLLALENEKSDINKTIYEFNVRSHRELGRLILKLLELQKRHADKEAKANPTDSDKQAHKDKKEQQYQKYQQDYSKQRKQKLHHLDKKGQESLKKIYKKASKLCHPDAVSEKDKAKAEEIFKELSQAYQEQDLAKVQLILENLKQGNFEAKYDKVSEKETLRAMLLNLREKVDLLKRQTQVLKNSEIYRKITNIEDWDTYFAAKKTALEWEIEAYEGL